MNKNFIAGLFLMIYSLHLQADPNPLAGGALFTIAAAGSVLHTKYSQNQQPVDPATAIIQATKNREQSIAIHNARKSLPKPIIRNHEFNSARKEILTTGPKTPSNSPITVTAGSPETSSNNLSDACAGAETGIISTNSNSFPTLFDAGAGTGILKTPRRTGSVAISQTAEIFPGQAPATAPVQNFTPVSRVSSTSKETLHTIFPNFSDPIFDKLYQTSHFRERKTDPKSFIDSAAPVQNQKLSAHVSNLKVRIFKHDTVEPNSDHAYWKDKNIIPDRISLYVSHGSYNEKIHGDRQSMATSNEHQINIFAQKLSLAQQKPVDIYYNEWAGDVNQNVRIAAGQDFAKIIANDPNSEIITLSHSHGGTVVAHAAHALKGKKFIDHAIMYGCPNFGEEVDIHNNNIGRIYNVHSEGDCTGSLGSFIQTADVRSLLPFSGKTTETTMRKKAANIVNIGLKINSENPNHRCTFADGLQNTIATIQSHNDHFAGQRNMLANAHEEQGKKRIQLCLDPRLAHPKATPNMHAMSKANLEAFQQKYATSMTDQVLLSDKFKEEIGRKLPGLAKSLGAAAAATIEYLAHDPIKDEILKRVSKIRALPTSEKINAFDQLYTNLCKKHSDKDPRYIQIYLEENLAYNQLKQELDDNKAIK